MYQVLHVFEVVLRNAMDKELCKWNATQIDRDTNNHHQSEWLKDPSHLLIRLVQRSKIEEAKKRADRALRRASGGQRQRREHGDILAQLSMGTWRFLLPDSDPGRQLLWNDALINAFPHLTRDSSELVNDVEAIYRLRNRVAHLEPLLHTQSVEDGLEAIRRVLQEIEPSTEKWLVSLQQVTRVISQRP